jgi:N-acetylglucosaminyldiphosphoundecaprenol N-acetyl-beta-D-mannosaminyltransferase
MYILGVRVDKVDKSLALSNVADFLASHEGHMIFTPNPEMLVDAQKDLYFKEVLNAGDLNLCDGRGLALVAKESIERIPGVDFMIDICEFAAGENKSVYLLGSGSSEVLKECKNKLLAKFPNLKIVGMHPGIHIANDFTFDSDANDAIIDDIILSAPDILFVAFGHKKQEKWIYGFLPELPSVRVAMGIGGSFDFISGKVKRAPAIFRRLGLEWLYRLVREPRRIKRIWKATVVFLYYYFKNK